jgi:hypothetical protein
MEPVSQVRTGKTTNAVRLGRFLLQRELGEGASCRVFLANDPLLERQVALKIPRFADDDPTRRERFFREAKTAARLRHPAIVGVFEGGRSADEFYIASEYVAGQTLATLLTAGRPDLRRSAEWTRQIAEALDYAHGEGIVHRDVKPGNIMIDGAGQPRLMDFGIARILSDDSRLTTDGNLLGTPAYISPEQARGDLQQIGPRSDQYSLGVVLYELLTGRTPFVGPPHAIIPSVINDPPPVPRRIDRKIPRNLEVICLKCLAKAPGERYASCRELAGDLAHWLRGESIAARRSLPWEVASRWVRRNRLVAGLLAATAILLATIAVVSVAMAFHVARERGKIDANYIAAREKHEEEQEQKRLANEKLEEVEKQTRLEEAHRNEALDAQREVEQTLDALQEQSSQLDELRKEQQDELRQLDKSQERTQTEEKGARQKQAEFAGASRALRDNFRVRDPLGHYIENLRLATNAIEARELKDAEGLLHECSPDVRDWEWSFLRALCTPTFNPGWTSADVTIEYCPDAGEKEYAGQRLHQYVRFSPDGKVLACLHQRRSVVLLDAGTGKPVRTLSPPIGDGARKDDAGDVWLFSLAFSRDGEQVIAIGEHDLVIWNTERAAPARTLFTPKLHHLRCDLQIENRTLILSWTGDIKKGRASLTRRTSSRLFPVVILDVQTGKEWRGLTKDAKVVLANLHSLRSVLTDTALSLEYSLNDKPAVGESERDYLHRVNRIAEISRASGAVADRDDPRYAVDRKDDAAPPEPGSKPMAVSPNGRRLVDERGIVDIESGRLLLPLPLPLLLDAGDPRRGDADEPYSFDWSPDGTRIAIQVGKQVRVVSIPTDSEDRAD